jgi:hypothetical protein
VAEDECDWVSKVKATDVLYGCTAVLQGCQEAVFLEIMGVRNSIKWPEKCCNARFWIFLKVVNMGDNKRGIKNEKITI